MVIDSPIKWLMSRDWVMVTVTIMAIWGGLGNYMLYFTTGMNGLSEDVYESAKIDGANGVQTFFRITLPMLTLLQKVLSPSILVILRVPVKVAVNPL